MVVIIILSNSSSSCGPSPAELSIRNRQSPSHADHLTANITVHDSFARGLLACVVHADVWFLPLIFVLTSGDSSSATFSAIK